MIGSATDTTVTGAGGKEEKVMCVGWKAIYISKKDVLTTDTKRAILAHNQFGQRIGCWSPSSPR